MLRSCTQTAAPVRRVGETENTCPKSTGITRTVAPWAWAKSVKRWWPYDVRGLLEAEK
jgi:hypothetical protein